MIDIESEWNELLVIMSGCDGKELLALTQRGKCVGLVSCSASSGLPHWASPKFTAHY
jgi:hypothetical protein